MNIWRPSTRLPLVVFCVLATCVAAVSCDRQEQLSDGHLRRVAAAARQKGESSAVMGYFDEPNLFGSSLADALEHYSFLTAVATPAQQVEVAPDEIRTWFIFDGAGHVAGARTAGPRCGTLRLPTNVKLSDGQLAMPLRIGSADVDGIRLTMQGADSELTLRPGQKYLLIVQLCPDQVIRPSYGALSVFYVDSQGGIRPVVTSKPNQTATSVLDGLGTIERLREAGEGKNDQ